MKLKLRRVASGLHLDQDADVRIERTKSNYRRIHPGLVFSSHIWTLTFRGKKDGDFTTLKDATKRAEELLADVRHYAVLLQDLAPRSGTVNMPPEAIVLFETRDDVHAMQVGNEVALAMRALRFQVHRASSEVVFTLGRQLGEPISDDLEEKLCGEPTCDACGANIVSRQGEHVCPNCDDPSNSTEAPAEQTREESSREEPQSPCAVAAR